MPSDTVLHQGPQPACGLVSAVALVDLLVAAEAYADFIHGAPSDPLIELTGAFRRANAALRGERVGYDQAVYDKAQEVRRATSR